MSISFVYVCLHVCVYVPCLSVSVISRHHDNGFSNLKNKKMCSFTITGELYPGCYGVVVSVQHRERTCLVQWLNKRYYLYAKIVTFTGITY